MPANSPESGLAEIVVVLVLVTSRTSVAFKIDMAVSLSAEGTTNVRPPRTLIGSAVTGSVIPSNSNRAFSMSVQSASALDAARLSKSWSPEESP